MQMFTLKQAGMLFDLSAADLRNYITRGYLRNFGAPVGPGRERQVTRTGIYELGLIRELNSHAIPLSFAASLVHQTFAPTIGSANVSLLESIDCKNPKRPVFLLASLGPRPEVTLVKGLREFKQSVESLTAAKFMYMLNVTRVLRSVDVSIETLKQSLAAPSAR